MKTFAHIQTLMARETEDQRIDIHDEQQLRRWSRALNLGTDVLQEAVMAFGPSVSRIRRIQLEQRTRTSPH